MGEINIRKIIRQVLNETDLADPSDVADEAFRRLTRGSYAEALRGVLRETARLVIAQQRRRPGTSSFNNAPTRSWKRDGIRALNLRDPYHTADGWKHLREMTRDDLLFAAKERREIAARTSGEADWLEELAHQLNPGQTIGDLYDTTGREAA